MNAAADYAKRANAAADYAKRANAAADYAKRALGSLLSPQGVIGIACEAAWIGAHVALYPLGFVEDRLEEQGKGSAHHGLGHLPPAHRGLIVGNVEAAGTPIILVHGVIDNRSIFTVLRRSLHNRGFGRTYALNYSPFTDDLRVVAARLSTLVEQVCEQTGYERVHIIGHSMGGTVGRYYVQRLGGDTRVHTLCTLGTPHQGSVGARFIPWPVIQQLRVDGSIIDELATPAPGCTTRFIAIWSDLDQLVLPQRNARITHPDLRARNILIRGVGHMSLPVDRRVVHAISQALAQLDHDGSTISRGATSIGSTDGRAEEDSEPGGSSSEPAARFTSR